MKQKISKNDFFNRIAKKNNMDVNVIKNVYDMMIDEMVEIMCEGQNLSLTGFGMFSLKSHKGHPVQFEAKTEKVNDYVVLKFSASDVLMSKIKGQYKS